jgi:hypothetical protein
MADSIRLRQEDLKNYIGKSIKVIEDSSYTPYHGDDIDPTCYSRTEYELVIKGVDEKGFWAIDKNKGPIVKRDSSGKILSEIERCPQYFSFQYHSKTELSEVSSCIREIYLAEDKKDVKK